MATQICPKCKQDAFTWRILDENPLTKWSCYRCGYTAWEFETQQHRCANCAADTSVVLQDENKKYSWCSNCNSISNLKNKT